MAKDDKTEHEMEENPTGETATTSHVRSPGEDEAREAAEDVDKAKKD